MADPPHVRLCGHHRGAFTATGQRAGRLHAVYTSPKQFFVRVTPQSALRVAEAISLARLLEQHALPTVTLGQWGNWRRSWHGIRESLLTGR